MQYYSLNVLVELADNTEVFGVNHQNRKLNDFLGFNLHSVQAVCLKIQNKKIFKFLLSEYQIL